MLLKGDMVTLDDGRTGEATEIWGHAKLFARVKLDASGKTIPVMASSITDYQRPGPKWKGGAPREKRKKADSSPVESTGVCRVEPEQLAYL